MKILIDNEINRRKWIDFLNSNQYSSVFQSPEFYDFYNKIPDQKATVFAVQSDDKIKVICVVTLQKETGIKSYFTRRAIMYGGPIIDLNSTNELEKLLSFINNYLRKKTIYLETRNYNDYLPYKMSFVRYGWEYYPHLNIQINLNEKSLESVLGEMKYNRKREIKLSIKEGTIYREAQNNEEVGLLYSILKELYQKRVNLPVPSLNYFIELFKSPIGKVFIVMHNSHVIGGCFCVYYQNRSIFTMYYCGLRNYHSKIYPTHLAIVAAIDFGISNNLPILDLMGAGVPGKEYGVRNYKTEFGGRIIEYGRFLTVYNHLLFYIGKLGISLKRGLKL